MIAHNLPPKDLPNQPGMQTLLDAETLASLQQAYRSSIPRDGRCHPALAEVITYALNAEGSFLRAQLAYGVMRAAGADTHAATTFGVAVELFHTASLLIDDMPCMDDATHRRGRVCAHVRYTEADAMLAALAIIHHGYDHLFQLLDGQPAATAQAARAHINRCLGATGILSGQSADLHFETSTRSGEEIASIASGKTGTLLDLVLGFPAILCGADASTRMALRKVADHWGISYQILDDFKDVLQPPSESGKTALRDEELDRPNYVTRQGQSSAWYRLNGELLDAGKSIELLTRIRPDWQTLQPLHDRLTQSTEALMEQIEL